MTAGRHNPPTTETPHFATLLVMALAPEQVGARLRQAREAKGWTHEEFARQAGVNLRTVQRWQQGVDSAGRSTLPRLATLMELADLFELPRSYFVEADDPAATMSQILERLGGLEAEVRELRRELAPEQADGRGSVQEMPPPPPRRAR